MKQHGNVWWILALCVGSGACEGLLHVSEEGTGRIRLSEKTVGPMDTTRFTDYGYLLRYGSVANPGDTLTYEEGGSKPGLPIGRRVDIVAIPVGPVMLQLTNHPTNCVVTSDNPLDLVVENRRRIEIEFEVRCQ